MKSFNLFHENKNIELLLEAIDIENFQPKDGSWNHHGSDHSIYSFNVEGDDCSDCGEYKNRNSGKCYSLAFGGGSEHVSISFSRCGSTRDSSKNVQWAFAKTVLKAVIEYINLKEPKSFSWIPVGKSNANAVQGRIVNSNARKKLYAKFFERYLFPHKYIPISDTRWISTREYNANYVPDGYPAVPEGLSQDSSPGKKSEAVEEMMKKTEENRQNILNAQERRRQEEYRRQREEEERRQREEEERIQRAVEDRELNPNQIRKDDIVTIIDINDNSVDRYTRQYEDRIAKVEKFYLRRPYGSNLSAPEVLYAKIRFAATEQSMEFNDVASEISAKNLIKENEQSKRERENRIAERLNSLISNPQYNPNNIQKGDEVISFVNNNSRQNDLVGIVTKISYTTSYRSEFNLNAEVQWNEESLQRLRRMGYSSSAAVEIKYLFKNNEENRREIRRRIRSHEVESQVSRNRERHERRRERDQYIASRSSTSTQSPEELQSLVNHPSNPQHLTVNDFVRITNPRSYFSRRYRNKKGTITSIRPDPYSDESRIRISVAIHRSHRVAEFYPDELERDTSQNAVRIQTRQRRRQEVSQLSRGFNIGDAVRVTRGRYNGRVGTILNFRLVNGILSAIVASEDRNFSVKIDFIERSQNPYGLPEMNLTFKNYISIVESF